MTATSLFARTKHIINPKLYLAVLAISHKLIRIINVISFVWERGIMSFFTNVSFINGMKKVN